MRQLTIRININSLNVLRYQEPLEPPWSLPEDLVCTELVIDNKRRFNPLYLNMLYSEHISFYHSDSLEIYTDE